MNRRDALMALVSKQCHCGNPKDSGRSHCRTCYFHLPPQLRKSLYRRVGEGYEEAYTESLEVLAGKGGAA